VRIERLFIEHPRSVGETYFEHLRQAFRFGAVMVAAGGACMLHALVPALFPRTGSSAVSRLYQRMVLNRSRNMRADPARRCEPVVNPRPGSRKGVVGKQKGGVSVA
jgi:Family of unknown function (DUF6356)